MRLCVWCTILVLSLAVLVIAQEPDETAPPLPAVNMFLKNLCAADGVGVKCRTSIFGVDNENTNIAPRKSRINWYPIRVGGSLNICMGQVTSPTLDCCSQPKPVPKFAMLLFSAQPTATTDSLTLYSTAPFPAIPGGTTASVQIGTLYDDTTKITCSINGQPLPGNIQKCPYGELKDFRVTMYRFNSQKRTFIFVHRPYLGDDDDPAGVAPCPPPPSGSEDATDDPPYN
jgi:hypothetical protein